MLQTFGLIYWMFLVLCQHCLASGDCQSNTNQVQICAPMSNFSPLPGNSGDFFSQLNGRAAGSRGKAGPKGEKGSRGPPGPEAENECSCNQELERLRNEIRQLKYGCPHIMFNFPRLNQITDYVRYRPYFPRLSSATICMWVRTSDFTDNCLLSYAINSHDNEMVIMLEGATRIDFYLYNSRQKIFTIPSMMNKWTHLCFWFSTATSQLGMYVNGTSLGSFPYRHSNIAGGGTLIIAQEQDRVNAGRLEPLQSFSGQMSSPIIWQRVLNASEILDVTQRCICPRDHAITMTMDNVELHGSTQYEMSDCLVV
ncbi:serum amyloid P-component-like [Ciona intestinalis]